MINELPFDRMEYDARIARMLEAARSQRLDALLLFDQASLYYLYGYDQIGYWVYQAVIVPTGGSAPVAICRAADASMIGENPYLRDVRVWMDDSERDPGLITVDVLGERGLLGAGTRLGIERTSHALLPLYYEFLRERLPASVTLADASDLVSELRLRKSPREIEYTRRAAAIMDASFRAGLDALAPGVRESHVHAAIARTMYENGGDPPAVPPPIGSGPRTRTQTHGSATERTMRSGEAVVIEIGAASRRYHSVGMRSAYLGTPPRPLRELHDELRDSLDGAVDLLRPGMPVADVARRALARSAQRRGRHVGYGIGIGYPPTWLDCLRIKESDPHTLEPGMVFFYFTGGFDPTREVYLGFGEPILITDRAYERLSTLERELVVV